MKFYTVDVMIPTYKPGQEFAELLPRLLEQTYPIRSIRVVNTGKKFWNPAWEQLSDKIMVEHIRPSEFDHGGTRRAMAESSDADLLLFMTQDAMPYDNACVEHLVEKFSLPHVKAAYARQLPRMTAVHWNGLREALTIRRRVISRMPVICQNLVLRLFSAPMSVQCMTAGHMKSWVDL